MEIVEVTVDELASRGPGSAVLDVREAHEYAEAHVPGAQLLALSELVDRIADVPDGSPLYLICRSGARSRRACELLAGVGIAGINVAGGTLAWIDSGRSVVAGPDRG